MSIQNSENSDVLEERIEYLNREMLESLYRTICRSLFEKDKMIFSFLLQCKIMELDGLLDLEEQRFFLTGGVSLGGELPENPAPEWLSEKSWGEITRLGDMACFKEFMELFKKYLKEFKEMYDS